MSSFLGGVVAVVNVTLKTQIRFVWLVALVPHEPMPSTGFKFWTRIENAPIACSKLSMLRVVILNKILIFRLHTLLHEAFQTMKWIYY